MNTPTYEYLLADIKRMAFATPEEAQHYLCQSRASVILAIRVTRAAFGLSLGQAKKVVDRHPVWHQKAVLGGRIQNVAMKVALRYGEQCKQRDLLQR